MHVLGRQLVRWPWEHHLNPGCCLTTVCCACCCKQLCADCSKKRVSSGCPVPSSTERHVGLTAAFPGHPRLEWFHKLTVPSCQACDGAEGHGKHTLTFRPCLYFSQDMDHQTDQRWSLLIKGMLLLVLSADQSSERGRCKRKARRITASSHVPVPNGAFHAACVVSWSWILRGMFGEQGMELQHVYC